MKKMLLLLFLVIILFGLNACKSKTVYLSDAHDFSNVIKAEVADFKSNNYKQIDYQEFIKTIGHSKLGFWKFVPNKIVILYDDKGKLYSLLFSKDKKCFAIEGKTFELSKKQSEKIKKLLYF